MAPCSTKREFLNAWERFVLNLIGEVGMWMEFVLILIGGVWIIMIKIITEVCCGWSLAKL